MYAQQQKRGLVSSLRPPLMPPSSMVNKVKSSFDTHNTMLLIPSQDDVDLELVSLLLPETLSHHERNDEDLQRQIFPILTREDDTGDKQKNGERTSHNYNDETKHLQIQRTLLLRPTQDRPGLVAWHLPLSTITTTKEKDPNNRRATCLAMTCGLFQCRFYGHVLVDVFQIAHGVTTDVAATTASNLGLLQALKYVALAGAMQSPDDRLWNTNEDEDDHTTRMVRSWILQAAKENYHDQEIVQRWTQITSGRPRPQATSLSSRSSCDSSDDSDDQDEQPNDEAPQNDKVHHEFVTQKPLCLQCRRPTSTLCNGCQGAYFCPPPRMCRQQGWSHDCLCPTWKVYVDRRKKLSTFPFRDEWYVPLVSKDCQISNAPYEHDFLTLQLGVPTIDGSLPSSDCISSWWTTERHGWSGGASASARQIYPERRVSYAQGFAPLNQIPLESEILLEEWKGMSFGKNETGLYRLKCWPDYYRLRHLPDSSPAALLLTFPLTLYYALVEYGTVPWTVARMLNRPLRIDIVGAEKELNFLDLFQELAFLLACQIPDNEATSPLLELVFVVRKDMLPVSLVGQRGDGAYGLDLEISKWLHVRVVEGTYGDSINPDLDCGSRIGSPDMVMGFNAGLYAYESWRSVLKYLQAHPSVVGVFSDYNEWSGLQCASLGGNRESLRMNPFRQPRAMPVYSMNLPQFSNGFLYAINPQELD
eukprot:scaffold1959_cov162-Amphora_coffeaeformis.AAC.6